MHTKINLKKGFTLAEVLLTLAIIGAVAALTVPSILITNIKKNTTVKVKKIFAELTIAENQIINDNNKSLIDMCTSSICLRDKFLEKITALKICDGASVPGNCFHKSNEWFTLTGTPISSSETHAALITNNGALINFIIYNSSCTGTNDGLNTPTGCGRARIDINGFKKPNVVGKDIFDFFILKDHISPRGTEKDDSICTPSSAGWGCAGYIIKNDKIDYY